MNQPLHSSFAIRQFHLSSSQVNAEEEINAVPETSTHGIDNMVSRGVGECGAIGAK